MSDLQAVLDRIEERQKVEGQIQLSTDATSLDFLQAIYRDPNQPMQRRMRAAQAAIPFEHPKLAVVAQIGGSEDLAERMMRAIAESQKVLEARRLEPPKVIDATPVEVQVVDPPDHSKPFPRRRRF